MKRLFINSHEVTEEEFDFLMGEGKAKKYLHAFRQKLRTVGQLHHQGQTLNGTQVTIYIEDQETLDAIRQFREGTTKS